MSSECRELIKADEMVGLYQCFPNNEYTLIRTPFLYPDGDIVDLYYVYNRGNPILTDYGETVRWLNSNGLAKDVDISGMISDVIDNYGVKLSRGLLTIGIEQGTDLALAITRLGQAVTLSALAGRIRASQIS